MKKKIPAAPVPAPAPKGFQKLSSFSKGMLIALSAIALLLVLVTFMDMSGFHLIWPEIIPLGCLLVLILALVWGCVILYRKIKTESRKKLFVVIALLIIMIISVGLTNSILQISSLAMLHKYSTIESPAGSPVVIMYAVDTGVEDYDSMIARMDARSAYFDELNGIEPSEKVAINPVFTSILEAYDSEDFGYAYFAFPRVMGLFYTSNCEMEGAIYRGCESTAKLLYEWSDDAHLRLYLEEPLPGDEGEVLLTLAG